MGRTMSDGPGTGQPYTKEQPKIADRCPSCGAQSLFVGAGGWLTCDVVGCKEPGVSSHLDAARAHSAKLAERVAELELMYADMKDCADRGSKSVFALPAAQARIAELEAALRRITQAHQDAAYDHEAQRAAVFNFVGNVAENALSASSPKDALRSVCEKVAREMDRVTSKDIEDDWPGTTDQRIDEVVSSIIGEVKP